MLFAGTLIFSPQRAHARRPSLSNFLRAKKEGHKNSGAAACAMMLATINKST
jgi:hypothetical protein